MVDVPSGGGLINFGTPVLGRTPRDLRFDMTAVGKEIEEIGPAQLEDSNLSIGAVTVIDSASHTVQKEVTSKDTQRETRLSQVLSIGSSIGSDRSHNFNQVDWKAGVVQSDDVESTHPEPPSERSTEPGSDAPTKMAAYVFLLPMRIQRTRFSTLLSHWSMATLILIPEAHAFLAVDCTDGKSRSHLIMSMTQLMVEGEPAIRVETCHSGTLLIRFPSQERLNSWIGVFSPQDLVVLMPSSSASSVPSSTSVAHTGVMGVVENSATSSSVMLRGNGEAHKTKQRRFTLDEDEDERQRIATVGHGHGQEQQQLQQEDEEIPSQQNITKTGICSTPIAKATSSIDMGTRMRLGTKATPGPDQIHSLHQGLKQQQWGEHSLPTSSSTSLNIPKGKDNMNDLNIPSDTQQQQQSTAISSLRPNTTIFDSRAEDQTLTRLNDKDDDDDDDDDLYDPEFGIGGKGRRHFQSRSSIVSPLTSESNSRRVTGGRQRRSNVDRSDAPSSSIHPGTIPPPAVISTAAAAVSAGWSESEALAAAMADPDGGFLSTIQIDRKYDTMSSSSSPDHERLSSNNKSNINNNNISNSNSSGGRRNSLSVFSLFGGQRSRSRSRQSRQESIHENHYPSYDDSQRADIHFHPSFPSVGLMSTLSEADSGSLSHSRDNDADLSRTQVASSIGENVVPSTDKPKAGQDKGLGA
ncbi:hypothetical protein BGX28_008101 [Mortierella sp. GBA30]|nr:hypothetical protein BGX28_008101 [Mortierella sp. GBA30]